MSSVDLKSIPETPLSTVPEKLAKKSPNPRSKNLRLFTGMKLHQQQGAQKCFPSHLESSSQEDSFKAPPVLKQKTILRQKALLREITSSKDDLNNIGSSASTEETLITPVIGDEFGESCSSDEICPIDEHDQLEAKIHKWLDEQQIYITDPREKRDQYYQKLKFISCKISQLQSSIYLQNEDEKTNTGSIESIETGSNVSQIALTTSTIPQLATLHDLPVQLNLMKIENSPLLMRRSCNVTKKININQLNAPVTNSVHSLSNLIPSPNSKKCKKSSIFRSSEPQNKLGGIKDIQTIPFPFEELEEDEKKDQSSIQELSSVSLEINEMGSIVCDNYSNSRF